jgi:hypothetical protein
MKTRLPAFLALAVLAPVASAEHFTFKVPYSISGLPDDINKMRIGCVALDQSMKEVGAGEQDVTIPVGGDTGNRIVVIRFNAHPGKRPETAVSYRCQMWEPFAKFFTQKEGTRLRVEGPIRR